MAHAVAAALSGSGHAIVQAGTGTGKSVGYLVPAALHAADGGAIVVATATIALQRQLVERDLPRIAEALAPVMGRPVTFAVLKGRNNYVCLQKLHGAAPEEEGEGLFDTPRSSLGAQAVAVRAWAESTSTGDRDEYPDDIDPRVWRGFSVGRRECVGESRCPYGEECFTVKRRQQAQDADIVVTNHAMLAIDAIEGIPLLPEHDAVIIDEGHELVDRVTAAVTGELTVTMLERSFAGARRLLDPETAERLEVAAEGLDDALRLRAAELSGPTRIEELNRDLVLALTTVRDCCHQAMAELNADKDTSDVDGLAARQRARGGAGGGPRRRRCAAGHGGVRRRVARPGGEPGPGHQDRPTVGVGTPAIGTLRSRAGRDDQRDPRDGRRLRRSRRVARSHRRCRHHSRCRIAVRSCAAGDPVRGSGSAGTGSRRRRDGGPRRACRPDHCRGWTDAGPVQQLAGRGAGRGLPSGPARR